MPGGDAAPVSRVVRLAPRAEARVRVADVVATPEPAVVVEIVGGQAVVSHELAANGDIATEPCARGASADWYFAAGTTLKGSQQFLVLFDPFGDDAIVDVTFLTDDGVQEPDSLQALVVPRRSRVSIPVHDAVPRQRNVAIHVHARYRPGRRRAVATVRRHCLRRRDRARGHRAVAGRGGAAARVVLPVRHHGGRRDRRRSGSRTSVQSSTTVEVNVILDGEQTLAPQSFDHPHARRHQPSTSSRTGTGWAGSTR